NDGWRRTGRSKQTLPTGCLKARQALADRRQIRRRRDTICRSYAKRAYFSALGQRPNGRHTVDRKIDLTADHGGHLVRGGSEGNASHGGADPAYEHDRKKMG